MARMLFYDRKKNRGTLLTTAVVETDAEHRAAKGDDGEAKADRTWVTASTDTPDRADDVVAQFWDLEEYRANPVIMFGHSYWGNPVGTGSELEVVDHNDGKALRAAIDWDNHPTNPRGQLCAHQYSAKIMRTVSVGFVPGCETDRSKLPDDHPAYREEEGDWYGGYLLGSEDHPNKLLEISAVPLPMNPEAVAEGLAKGLDLDQLSMRAFLLQALEQDLELRELVRRICWHQDPALEPPEPGALPEPEDGLARFLLG